MKTLLAALLVSSAVHANPSFDIEAAQTRFGILPVAQLEKLQQDMNERSLNNALAQLKYEADMRDRFKAAVQEAIDAVWEVTHG